jgi:hypothetical protein
MTIENVFEAAKTGGIDKTVISNPGHQLRHMTPEQQLAAIQKINRYLTSLADKHDNIYAMATGQPYGGDKFLRETERTIREDGAKAVIILSSLPGHYPDDDAIALLRTGDVARRSRLRASAVGWLRRRAPQYLSPCLQYWASDGRRARDRPSDRARRIREVSATEACRKSPRRRHLRDDRAHGLTICRRKPISWARINRC